MRISKGSLKLIACLFATIVTMAISGTPAEAFLIQEKTGMTGITDGQTLRVNVANIGTTAGAIEPCIKVFYAMGRLLAEFEEIVGFDLKLHATNTTISGNYFRTPSV